MTLASTIANFASLALFTGCSTCFSIAWAQQFQENSTGHVILKSGSDVLSFPPLAKGGFGLQIHAGVGSVDAYSTEPIQILVCKSCVDESVEQPFTGAPYASIKVVSGSIQASATFTSSNGSRLRIEDLYKTVPATSDGGGQFTMERTVSVISGVGDDRGFNSEFVLGFTQPRQLEEYHLFAPAIWYDHNAHSAQAGGFGTNPLNNYFFWRETRSALPIVMLQDAATGTTLSIGHINSSPVPGKQNQNPNWQVDSTVQYGSIGVQKKPAVSLGFIYPASEGDGSYVGGNNKSLMADGPSTKWVRRSHPFSPGLSHTYTLLLSLGRYATEGGNADFKAAMAHTWEDYYDQRNPTIADVPSAAVYSDAIKLLNGYVEKVNGATGLPFGRPIIPNVTPANNPVFQMGYVGQDIPLGFALLRDGVLHSNPTSLAHGEALLDFWANNARQSSGLPLTVYDANIRAYQRLGGGCPYPIFTRLVSDGMEGMVLAAIFAREHNMAHPGWEDFSQSFGDWVVSHQNADGSFYRAFNPDGSIYTNPCNKFGFGSSKANTPDLIRFLVELYFATGSERYLKAAQSAGQYSLGHIYNAVQYIGGTIDNQNVLDKEAGVEALHGALALLDVAIAQGDQQAQATWLAAAQDAADYTRTWQYAWTFPIELPAGAEPSGAYPAYRFAGPRAIGIIATGQSSGDISLSYESYDFFRLFLFNERLNTPRATRSAQADLTMAKFLWNNTKLTTQLTGVADQQFGYTHNGLLGEGVDVSGQVYGAGKSSQTWLPWLTNAELDTIIRLQDTFKVKTLDDAASRSKGLLEQENEHVYPRPGSLGWGQKEAKR